MFDGGVTLRLITAGVKQRIYVTAIFTLLVRALLEALGYESDCFGCVKILPAFVLSGLLS